jgi:DNA-directed RNA polymerase specialized sigma subunit
MWMHITGLKNPERVIEIRDNLQEMVNLLNAVLDNKTTMKSIAEYLNITPQKLNLKINAKLRPYVKQQFDTLTPDDMVKIIESIQPPAYFMLKDAYIHSEFEPKCIEFPSYDENKIYELVKNEIYNKSNENSDRNYDIVCKYYGINCEKKTMDKIGDEYNVTRSRIDQIIRKAVYVLKKPESIKQIFKLPKMQEYAEELQIIEQEEENFKQKYYKAAAAYKNLMDTAKTLDLYDEIQREIISKYPEITDQNLIDNTIKMNTPIDQLNLSVRLYHVLWRNNLHTIKDICNTPFEKIFFMRNLGKTSLLELINKLQELDCLNPNWKNDIQTYMSKL